MPSIDTKIRDFASPGGVAHRDVFLKIDGIDGESTDDKHKGSIEVLSYSYGASNQSSIGSGTVGAGSGRVHFQDVAFTVQFSKASPKLMLHCASGQHIKKIVMVARKAGGGQQEYLTMTLSDSVITSYQSGHGGDSGLPIDSFTIAFSKIETEYKEQKNDGTLGGPTKVGFNIVTNKPV